jgi:hypothetical protein
MFPCQLIIGRLAAPPVGAENSVIPCGPGNIHELGHRAVAAQRMVVRYLLWAAIMGRAATDS